jgi:VWFA-related protein
MLVGCALVLSEPAHVGMQARTAAAAPADDAGVVRITAVVTDRGGQLLGGLKAADFELRVDGEPQALETVEMTAGGSMPRAFAFLLDEFHTAAADGPPVRDSLLQLVDRYLRPDDLAVAVKPLDALTNIRPSTDRGPLRQAIASFEGRKGDYTPKTAFERTYLAQAPAAVAYARGQIVTSALRAIGVALTQARGVRPAIVLVGDGFERMRTSRDVPANLQTAVRVANRADAPVYAFAPALARAADSSEPGDPAVAALRALAAQTGGDLFTGTAVFADGFARMIRDFDRHYVLTYRAAHGSDGKFHAVQVGVRRPGVQVRARTGYVSPLSAAVAAPASSTPLRVLRRSALIQSWSGVEPTAPGHGTVTLTWESSLRSGATVQRRPSTIVITASAPDGTVLFDGAVGPAGDPASPDVPNRASFGAPTGTVRVDMKILDAKGVVIDTEARDVTLKAPRQEGPTIYPPAVMRTRSAREFRQALEDGTVPPVATRDFRRTDRLLIRVPAYAPSGAGAPVSAVLLNRWRQRMRDVDAIAAAPDQRGVTHFDLPLAGLAPGEYTLRVTVGGPRDGMSDHVTFRVQG